MNPDKITIKGIRQGLLVTLGEGEWANRDWGADLRALEARLSASPSFFRGGRVALDVGSRELGRPGIEEVRTLLARHHVELWAVVSGNPVTEAAVQELGLVVDLGPLRPHDHGGVRPHFTHGLDRSVRARTFVRRGPPCV